MASTSPVNPESPADSPASTDATASAPADWPAGASSVSTKSSPETSLRFQPKRSAAAGLHEVILPPVSIVKQRPSSSQPVTSAEVGRDPLGPGVAAGAVSIALMGRVTAREAIGPARPYGTRRQRARVARSRRHLIERLSKPGG